VGINFCPWCGERLSGVVDSQGALPLQEIKGTEGRGFYFSATDRAPGPGE
jgi:hypothetical protein